MRSTTITKLVLSGILSSLLSPQVNASPQDQGSWGTIADWPFRTVHSVLTPQGKILSIGRPLGEGSKLLLDVWNPELGLESDSHTPVTQTIPSVAIYGLSSAVLLPDSNDVLVTGTSVDGRNYNATYIFNTKENTIRRGEDMKAHRVTSKSIILPSGEIMVNGAGGFEAWQEEQVPEIYSPKDNKWRLLSDVSMFGVGFISEWVKPDGKVFGYTSLLNDRSLFSIDPTGNGSLEYHEHSFRDTLGPEDSVMYRPGKIFYAQGNIFGRRPTVVDINGATPIMQELAETRTYDVQSTQNSTILPDGKVMTISTLHDSPLKSRLEIWDPATEIWSLMALPVTGTEATTMNNLTLLKDGRVLSSDISNYNLGYSVTGIDAGIFSPPYLFDDSGQLAERPEIISAPLEASYGKQIKVTHGAQNIISRVTLIKSSRVESARMQYGESVGQRFMELEFDDIDNGVSIKLPGSANQAPPGHYLMYLIDNKGVPSEGHIIHLFAQDEKVDVYPNAVADIVKAKGGAAITIDALANDNGTGLVLNKPHAYSLEGGSVTLTNNKIIYRPKIGFNGVDKIWYVFRDVEGRTNYGVVTITVSDNEIAKTPYPAASPDNVAAKTRTEITIDVLANDIGDGLILNAPNVWSLNGGRVSLVNNKLIYKSKSGYVGSDNIWYTFEDLQGRSNSGQVNITLRK